MRCDRAGCEVEISSDITYYECSVCHKCFHDPCCAVYGPLPGGYGLPDPPPRDWAASLPIYIVGRRCPRCGSSEIHQVCPRGGMM